MVYRGQELSKEDFERLMRTTGGLISFNNFLSTSEDREMALGFAVACTQGTDLVGIFFEMKIDPKLSTTPFAFVGKSSFYEQEQEVLFSMHTVCRVGEIQVIHHNFYPLYQVQLTLTEDDNLELDLLTKSVRNTCTGSIGWDRLGYLLITMGEFDKAEDIYREFLLDQLVGKNHSVVFNKMGIIKYYQGDYSNALSFYEKAIDFYEQNLDDLNHLDVALVHNNIGNLYYDMGEYEKALLAHQKSLSIKKKSLPANHLDFAASYNNIGLVYNRIDEYSKALVSYEKALNITQKSLPSNHFELVGSYHNIGSMYNRLGH